MLLHSMKMLHSLLPCMIQAHYQMCASPVLKGTAGRHINRLFHLLPLVRQYGVLPAKLPMVAGSGYVPAASHGLTAPCISMPFPLAWSKSPPREQNVVFTLMMLKPPTTSCVGWRAVWWTRPYTSGLVHVSRQNFHPYMLVHQLLPQVDAFMLT